MRPDDYHHEQFVALLAKHQFAIFNYVLSLLPNWTDADDVFQQTSVVLWRKFDEFDLESPASNFARWGCQIARYKVLNHLKKQRRDRHVFSDELVSVLAQEGIETASQSEAESRALQACLGKLQPRHRPLLRECYGDTTIKQVAESLDRTPNSLYKLLNRIRDGLLHCIQQTLTFGAEH
jgi:RNA polymerase sigma-70 factor, ECF subfamily